MTQTIGKREENRQKRRGCIVEVATRAFMEHGYTATSMSAIADELGGSKATLWSHFASKEDLFIAVVDQQVERFAAEIEGVLTEEQFTIDGLRQFCTRFLKTLLLPRSIGLFRVIMGDGGRFPEINSVFHVRGPARLMHQLTEYLATRMRHEQAASIAMLTSSVLVGWRSQILTRPTPVQPGEIEAFVDDFLTHLRLPEYESPSQAD